MKDEHYYKLLDEIDEAEDKLAQARFRQFQSALIVIIAALSWACVMALIVTSR